MGEMDAVGTEQAHTKEGSRPDDPYIVRSVDNAVRLLFELARGPEPGPHGVTELAKALGFTKNATFRLLKTLERHRLVVQDASRRYRLGAGLLTLSAHVDAGLGLIEAAAPVLSRLLMETGESVHLAVRDGLEAVIVDSRESAHAIRLTTEIGGRYSLHAGACPQAILAALPESVQERVYGKVHRLPAYTERTPADRDGLRHVVREVQARGYSISDEDVDVGARGVGAAIVDAAGMPVGAISVGGPTTRLTPERLHEFGRLVAEAAAEVGARLGMGAGTGAPGVSKAAADRG